MGVAAGYPLWRNGSGEVIIAFLVGAGLSTLNVLAGYVALDYGFGREESTFMKVVLGGMGIRMVVMLGSLVGLIKYADLPIIPLTVSLLASYSLYLIIEVRYIQKKFRSMNQEFSR